MNLIRNNLLNTSGLSGASFLAPDDGAGAGVGETPAPAATPASETAPAATPTATPASGGAIGETTHVEPTPEPDGDGKMFAMPSDEALFALDDTGEVEEPAPKSEVKTPAPAMAPAATAPATTPAVTPPAPAAPGTPPAEVSATPAPGTSPAATPEGTAPPQAPQAGTPEPDIIQLLDQGRQQITDQLSKVYAISDEDAEAIGIVNKGPLEKLAANLHFNVMRAQVQMLQQTLPNAIARILDMKTNEEKFTAGFYKANPELNRETDHALVTQYAHMFWAANPKGTLADMNKQVGTAAKAHLGKLTATATPPATPPGTPGVAPKKVPMKPSFTPAGSGGVAPAAKGVPQPGDVWGQLAEAMMNPEDE